MASSGGAPRKIWVPRVCAVASSSASIVFAFIGFALMAAIHPSKLKFRHQLISFLILYDLLKAVMMLAYCIRGVGKFKDDEFWSENSINALGWFTGLSVEASDLIILCFAVHLFLVIFKSKLPKWLHFKSKTGEKNSEGGLYEIKNWVFLSIFLIAVILASCGFIEGFNTLSSWAYFLPSSPIWIFAWIFRYVIISIIFSIYIGIYVYVFLEYKKMAKRMNITQNQQDNNQMFRSTFGDSLWYKLGQYILMLVFPDVGISAKLHGHGLNTEEDLRNIEKLKNESYISSSSTFRPSISTSARRQSTSLSIPPQAVIASDNTDDVQLDIGNNINRRVQTELATQRIQELINEESMLKFEQRRIQILNQMKLVFIYPISYCFIWFFPFINQIMIWVRNEKRGSLWTEGPSGFIQGFSAVINVSVFLIREKPWRLLTPVDDYDIVKDKNNWRRYLSFLPLFKHYRSENFEIKAEPPRSSSEQRDTWTSNDSSTKYMDINKYSDDYQNTMEDDNINDEYEEDDIEEDIMDFLNRGPPEPVKFKNTKNNVSSSHTFNGHHHSQTRRSSVNWNLNVFENNKEKGKALNNSNNLDSANVLNAPVAGSSGSGGDDDDEKSEEFDLLDFLKTAPPPRV